MKKGAYAAEIRSMEEGSNRVTNIMYVKLVSARRGNMIAGQVLRCAIPYIKKEIPIMIIFRALGFIRDRDILVRGTMRTRGAQGGLPLLC